VDYPIAPRASPTAFGSRQNQKNMATIDTNRLPKKRKKGLISILCGLLKNLKGQVKYKGRVEVFFKSGVGYPAKVCSTI
jgi:hypothetical protein